MNKHDFDYLTDEIINLFPNENKEVYYVKAIEKKSSRSNKSVPAKGKLVDKYRNKLQFFRECEIKINEDDDQNDTNNTASSSGEVYYIKNLVIFV